MADRYHLRPITELLAIHYAVQADGCWVWTGRLYPNGYGQFHVRRKVVYAHIAAYEIYKGAVPDGLELDHKCRNRACVNPEHLEPVTHHENVRRGNAVRSCCKNGHEYNELNTCRDKHGWARCRICANDQRRQKYFTNKGGNVGPWNRHKTHCNYGHPFDDRNTRIISSSGCRVCKICDARRSKEARSNRALRA